MKNNTLHIGIDIGSTTVKIAVLDDNNKLLHARYTRHYTDVKHKVSELLWEAYGMFRDYMITVAITGSGGIALAEYLHILFVQEVIAGTKAVRAAYPQTDVIIELGGEDAKITYVSDGNEHRMNGACAGGTGSFIDQMATLLHTDAAGLNALSAKSTAIYPIAARCGVFAKTDIQALMNDGASNENIAASVFQSIVIQTIIGLACGKPIHGNICFLGGPLTFLSELRHRFALTLHLKESEMIIPPNAQVYMAIGAAIGSRTEEVLSFNSMIDKIQNLDKAVLEKTDRVPPLFRSENELEAFRERHNQCKAICTPLTRHTGPCFLGIDAGSTTIKAILINNKGEILYQFYRDNQGKPLAAAKEIITHIYKILPSTAFIAKAGVTGYGEALLKKALKLDIGEVETIAHYQAAAFFCPDVDFILDIGGQDMKCCQLRDGYIDNILLNEACSSGCGSFLDTFAQSLNMNIQDFSQAALLAEHPTDLGSRCTVFMNSKVKQAQKEGATLGEISAGLSYSVIKNALYKVIKIKNPAKLGKHIVVQGGTFYNDAVLRAFELLLNRHVTRPDIAGLMGAFGMALIAKTTFATDTELVTKMLSEKELSDLTITTTIRHCNGCSNTCLLTVNTFNDDRSFIIGNRCERGISTTANVQKANLPNLYTYTYNRLFKHYQPLPQEEAPRGSVGLPRVLNMYEDYPFWFTFFTKLNFRVILSDESSKELSMKAMDTVPSDSACYPAKLVHGHIQNLIDKKVTRIFYPCIQNGPIECSKDNTYHCPMVTSYPEVIRNNMNDVLANANIPFYAPFLPLNDKDRLVIRLQKELRDWQISSGEVINAVETAWAEQEHWCEERRQTTEKTLAYLKKRNLKAIVLAGRPYHIDPEINHGIPELINSLGLAVLTEAGVAHLHAAPEHLRVLDQWSYHSRLYRAAAYVNTQENLQLVELNSFGCGLDSIVADQVQEILAAHHKIHTLIKIDEGTNLGAVRIRLRSLLSVMNSRRNFSSEPSHEYNYKRPIFTKTMKETYTILAPEMSPFHFPIMKAAFSHEGYQLEFLPHQGKTAIDTGLTFIHNDACYPAIMTLGQIMTALCSGKYDLNRTAVMVSQTGGGCRASNYIGFLRKALRDAGFDQVPIISINNGTLDQQPGFTPGFGFWHRMLMGVTYGDALMQAVYRVRPYEKEKGSTMALCEQWKIRCSQQLIQADWKQYKQNLAEIISDFDTLPITAEKKPRIGLVGEIYVKFHPVANNRIAEMVEEEGGEIITSGLMDFFLYCLLDHQFRYRYLSGSWLSNMSSRGAVKIIEWYRKPYRKAIAKSQRFDEIDSIYKIADMAKPYLSLGHETGEGWFLSGDMIDLIKKGAKNIVCLQPFACLPNHITGKGMIKTLKHAFPGTNITAIDYDPSASTVNQTNRLKLMLATTFENIRDQQIQEKTPKKETHSIDDDLNNFG